MSPTRFRCANSLGRHAPVAQLAARGSHNPEVASSILVWSKSPLFVLDSPGAMCSNTTPALPSTPTSRLAQLVERKTLNLVVVGSSPTVGASCIIFLFFLNSNPFGDHFRPGSTRGWMAERSKALVLGTSLFGGVGSNPTPISPLLSPLV